MGIKSAFREGLPNGCPPVDAIDLAYEAIVRFLPANPPAQDHFDSHAAKGKPRPKSINPCVWASCSFLRDKATALKYLPKIRGNYKLLALLTIPKGAGLSKGDKHIDFWFFESFDPLCAITDIESI